MPSIRTESRQVSWVVPSRDEAVGYVRHRTVAEIRAWGIELADPLEVELVVTELVTNAVSHAGGQVVGVGIQVAEAGAVVIRVSDSHPGFFGRRVRRVRREPGEHGRGLVMLRQLARCWWWEPLSEGKVVCALVEVSGC
ncbi:ATP-binding protein [Kitasatospora purpeofusca]|uniref:ATP-binding protein n=1 Tax=Kitasatospora purpeofusca TaxID=67352 RepID=UPI0022594CF1|nr:ATP-binding protein [Kitasatospora purpeofusca]MCX4752247.1 ATP-binding protein [Kitasatospora purpeofusca]WSR31836.1 ATP-binding protein [Kitasatospora purpeofusca]